MQVERRLVGASVERVEALGPDCARVDLVGPQLGLGTRPGRFVMVEAPDRADCVLFRPYSCFLSKGDDHLALLVKAVGRGSRALTRANPGARIRVLGPFGNTFPVPTGDLWLVGGGVGAAPWGGLCGRAGVQMFVGARSAPELGFARALAAAGGTVEMATDDGSQGYPGSVADLVHDRLAAGPKPAQVFACGPTAMLAALARLTARFNVPCWVSLEERMGCGFGVCRGCAHRDAAGGWRCICEDGPVYPATVIFGAENVAG